MNHLTILLTLTSFSIMAQTADFRTPFEKNNNTTATYQEATDFYKKLDTAYDQLQVTEWGTTDAGFPLQVAVLSKNKNFDPVELRKQGKCIMLINNAIHPGEPEGVDATMMLVRDYLQKPDLQPFLENVVLAVVPFYNIGGGLNRGCCSRANQNGPDEYGFRGNAKNLDLNRDFIKCDSKNAKTFTQIFNYWLPDVFIDNHTSNGADYPYTMTMLATQEDKLGPVLGKYLREDLLPVLYQKMAERKWEMCPYVNVWGSTPDKGIPGFNDSPRFASGFAATHHCIAFVPETHMLKPYPDRLRATYAFMDVTIQEVNARAKVIIAKRKEAITACMEQETFPLDWKMDEANPDMITFKGYEAKTKPSEVTGLERLWYDRSAPYTKEIPYWNHFKPSVEVVKPLAYIFPQAYSEVAGRLQWNGVQLLRLSEDTEVEVEMYSIKKYKDRGAYEGHYLHQEVEVEVKTVRRKYHKGDYVAFTGQPAVRFLVETLEPQGVDSYFAWNFFDGILGQKEGFSDYVFEDMAAEFLKKHPDVKAELEAKKKEDPEFAKSKWAMLGFVYQRTPYYEPTFNLYPVGRVVTAVKLPVEE
ncbi:MAG: hypothetical protein KDD27_23685 [Saprospiraceae bacterium]|nr:hypothetical protein [Saprospiraceae bacterium]